MLKIIRIKVIISISTDDLFCWRYTTILKTTYKVAERKDNSIFDSDENHGDAAIITNNQISDLT